MLEKAEDRAPVAVDNEAAMKQYGTSKSGTDNEPAIKVKYIPAIQILNSRGDFSACMGVIPPWIRPWIKKFPWFARGNVAVQNLAGIAVAAVGKRLALDARLAEVGGSSARNDLLRRLQEARDEQGHPMGQAELTAEAMTQLIAGSDTTSK
jgi:benzoate 4-monooxygenase